MSTQASIIINFFGHPLYCNIKGEHCSYLIHGRCVLRIVKKEEITLSRFLALKSTHDNGVYLKDPSCKFIWEKSKRTQQLG